MTFKQHCKKRLVNNVERLQKILALDAPDVILAAEMVMLLNNAKGAFGEELVKAQLEDDLKSIRQGWAYCQHCDSQVAIERSHHPICEQCDAKWEAYADEMERAMDEMDGNSDREPL